MLPNERGHLKIAIEIAESHHERFDGTGYPNGLTGEEIPLSARIVSVADVYDALRSARPYKRAFSHEETMEIILHGDGRTEPTHFDPKVLKAFEETQFALRDAYNNNPDPHM
jgi:putative two-component system response regulator